jgi:hypothetical protein
LAQGATPVARTTQLTASSSDALLLAALLALALVESSAGNPDVATMGSHLPNDLTRPRTLQLSQGTLALLTTSLAKLLSLLLAASSAGLGTLPKATSRSDSGTNTGSMNLVPTCPFMATGSNGMHEGKDLLVKLLCAFEVSLATFGRRSVHLCKTTAFGNASALLTKGQTDSSQR